MAETPPQIAVSSYSREGDSPSTVTHGHRSTAESTYSKASSAQNNRMSHADAMKNVSMMRRTDFGDYYPDGGWGWVVCGGSFLVQFLCHGLHLAGGAVLLEMKAYFKTSAFHAVLLTSFGYGGSLLLAPLVTALIRRKSCRLLAVIGALLLPLATLFLSFSKQLHQAIICWCLVVSLASGALLTTSSAIVGRYFRKRRQVAEMLTLGGSGVGMAVVTVSFRHLLSALKWLRGWQAMSLLLLPAGVASCLYRSPSLYHPRRHVILHVRNMHKSKTAQQQFENRPPYLDFKPLSMRSLQVIMVSAALTALGTYTPYMILVSEFETNRQNLHVSYLQPGKLEEEGLNSRSTTLLQVFMGVSYAFGGLIVGLVEVKSSTRCLIVPQYFCQLASLGCGITTLMYIPSRGFYAASVYSCLFGLMCGAHAYSLKVHTCEMMTLKVFERAWSYVMFAQAVPVVVGPTVTVIVNDAMGPDSRSGFIFAAVSMILGSMVLCVTSHARHHPSNYHVIQIAHLQAKTKERDLAFLDMDISTHEECTSSVCGHRHRRSKLNVSRDAWSDIEAMSPMSSTDKVAEFLLYTQSMLQTYSEVHHIPVPNVHVEINSEDDSPSDLSPLAETRAIKALKLEATVSRQSARSSSETNRIMRYHQNIVCGHKNNLDAKSERKKACEMMTTV